MRTHSCVLSALAVFCYFHQQSHLYQMLLFRYCFVVSCIILVVLLRLKLILKRIQGSVYYIMISCG